jgi:hypothetical protein
MAGLNKRVDPGDICELLRRVIRENREVRDILQPIE